jgi:DNA-3-methyladenine glycosylase I
MKDELILHTDGNLRCYWCGIDPEYVYYHDQIWGKPEKDSKKLFRMLMLESQQAGLSWKTVLDKIAGYDEIFHGLDPYRVSKLSDDQLEDILLDKRIIRNRLKVFAIRKAAFAYLDSEKTGVDFSQLLWSMKDAEEMSKKLKSMGMIFVGPTICYAFMQAAGMVNDHFDGCCAK